MISRKKEIRFSQKQRELDKVVKQQARLSFFSKLPQRFPAKIGGAAIFALIVLHFVSQFIFFQNERVQNEVAPPKLENERIAEIKQEYEPVESVVAAAPEPIAPPVIAKAERNVSPSLKKTAKKKQLRETKAERLQRAERTERVFHADEVASVFPHGRFLTLSATR